MGGLAAARSLVGLENHRAVLHAANKRVRHAHASMAKAAGFEVPDTKDDEMGDLSVTGDQTTYNITDSSGRRGIPGWAAALIAATAGAIGLAGASLLPSPDAPEPLPAVEPEPDPQFQLLLPD